MKIQFESKIYPGIIARPSVEARYHENEKLLSIITPWGNQNSSDLMMQLIDGKFSSAESDSEATVPPMMGAMNKQSRNLKAMINLANFEILDKINKTSYVSACEATLATFQDNQMCWAHVGQPYIFLLRQEKLQIIQAARDLSIDYSMEAPLPQRLLGIDRGLDIPVQNLLVQNGDMILFYSGKELPSSFFTIKKYKSDFQETLQMFFDLSAKEKKDSPFWLGAVSIKI